jgi:NTP pyrophosphatase (non-canonical NTP hydrolase)
MTPDQFVQDAIRTESRIPTVTVNKQTYKDLVNAFVAIGSVLDQVKKNAFYKKPYNVDEMKALLRMADGCIENVREDIDLGILPNDSGYGENETRVNPRLFHSVIGIATEAVELLEAIKIDSPEVDTTNLREEFGDLMWYIAIGVDETGGNFEAVLDKVIAKLKARYPNKFTTEDAINRNLEIERLILEGKE